jgi:hypothetical protein
MGKDLALFSLTNIAGLPKRFCISFRIRTILGRHLQELIKASPGLNVTVADESCQLNNRLGRRRGSIEELKGMVRKSNLTDKCKIVEEGGVWLHITK